MPAFLHKRESFFLLVALALGAVAGVVLYLSRPTTLRVAVGPRDRVETHLIQAYADALARAREDIRLEVVSYDDVRDSAAALQSGRADLAVVRPDVRLPENGLTLAVLHDEALIVAAPRIPASRRFPISPASGSASSPITAPTSLWSRACSPITP